MLTPQSSPAFPWEEDVNAEKREFAESLDKKDSLAHFREQFIIPTTQDLTRKTIIPSANGN